MNIIEQDDGWRLTISSILDNLCIWFREFVYRNDQFVCQNLLNKLSQCYTSNFYSSKIFHDLEDRIQCQILQARAKYLETLDVSIISNVK